MEPCKILDSHRTSSPAEDDLEKEDAVEIERKVENDVSSEDSWCMSEDFIDLHREEPRRKLYEPDEGTCPVPWKYFDVVRQTKY